MSDDVPEKVTTDVSKKVKDPKRVEAGKRLAAISKAAKEKKMREMINMEKSLNENDMMGKNVIYLSISAFTLLIIYMTVKVLAGGNRKVPEEEREPEVPKNRKTVLENL